MIHKPQPGTYAPYFERYISLVGDKDPVHILESQVIALKALISEIPSEKEEFAYAEGKWTVKEVIGHIMDTERIMSYRALCIARGEQQNLPGFDEDAFVANAKFNARSLMNLAHEFGFVRESTISFYKTISAEDLDRAGTANANNITPRALLFIIAGHHLHHERILRERYLDDLND